MKFQLSGFKSPLISVLSIIFLTSCNKDSDILTDYVVSNIESDYALSNLLVSDNYLLTNNNEPIILDVLNNDLINSIDEVKIIETTQPENGIVTINENNTLTYTPNENNSDSQIDDTNEEETFNYTVEVEEDGIVKNEEGKVIISVDYDYGQLKAFPTAEGFGKNTTGGRGGRIIEVTNLNDSGSGSLRNALEAEGKRIIIFKVGGTIECKSYLSILNGNGNVTIAGQTAPGGGITIKGAELRIQASNVIVRYVRIRAGNETTGTNEDGLRIIAYSGTKTSDVIIDHCSISWGKDENVEIGGISDGSRVENVTIQNSIISENIGKQYGLILWNRATNISIIKNLFAHNKERNIRSSTCTSTFEMINNVVYGFRAGTLATYENQFDIIGNTYKSSNSLTPENIIDVVASLNNCPNGIINYTKAFVNDNIYNGNDAPIGSTLKSYLKNSPTTSSGSSVMDVNEIEDFVLNKVGTSLPLRDAVDNRIINDVKTGSGNLISNVSNVGGYPNISNGEAYEDEDKDGIDDAWELAVGLNPTNSSDAKLDHNSDGYSNLDAFLEYLTQSEN
ncbi:Ig-like domain-containing protein [Aurantibacter sp.]|uniref:Ig-like domain-containing protein n=1 Tax=Aurantibacter sp. TaxID=2807103 RepID=UPI003267F102